MTEQRRRKLEAFRRGTLRHKAVLFIIYMYYASYLLKQFVANKTALRIYNFLYYYYYFLVTFISKTDTNHFECILNFLLIVNFLN